MIQKFRGRELVINGAKIRHETQPPLQFLRFPGQFIAVNLDRAAGAFLQAGDCPHGGGLACAIRSDETAYIAGFNRQGKVVDRHHLGKIHPQMFNGEHGVGHAVIIVPARQKARTGIGRLKYEMWMTADGHAKPPGQQVFRAAVGLAWFTRPVSPP